MWLFGTIIEEDRCLSAILGRSTRDLRDPGLATRSDSDPLEVVDEALDTVGDKLGRAAWSRMEVLIEAGSGYAAVAVEVVAASDMFRSSVSAAVMGRTLAQR